MTALLGVMQELIKDRIGLMEQRGRLLLKLPQKQEAAEDIYRQVPRPYLSADACAFHIS